MKRIRIIYKTAYYYHEPVRFGPHRALLRPREGHDVRIASGRTEVEPKASVRWLRDIYGNSVGVITFTEPARELSVLSEIDVKLAGSEHVSVAVAREQEKASPLSGTWEGPPSAFDRMEVSVQVVPR